MIDLSKLSQFAEELSNTPCPVCGKYHKVELNYSETVPHLPSLLFAKYPEGACDSFKDFVNTFLSTR